MPYNKEFMLQAIEVAKQNIERGGGYLRRSDSKKQRSDCLNRQLRNHRQRPHRSRRSECHTPGVPTPQHLRPLGLRNILVVRTMPNVPQRNILGSHRHTVLRRNKTRRSTRRFRRLVHIPRAQPTTSRTPPASASIRRSSGKATVRHMERQNRQNRILKPIDVTTAIKKVSQNALRNLFYLCTIISLT